MIKKKNANGKLISFLLINEHYRNDIKKYELIIYFYKYEHTNTHTQHTHKHTQKSTKLLHFLKKIYDKKFLTCVNVKFKEAIWYMKKKKTVTEHDGLWKGFFIFF